MVEKKKKKIKIYYQVNTKNDSFIKMHIELKKAGIKNNKFFLKLYDKSLLNIDPHNPNLSVEEQFKIQVECSKNFWYFIRECVRIPVPGGLKPYEIHRGNLSLSWCLLKNINTILILPRQNYKSISAICFYLWAFLFGTNHSEFGFLNKKYSDSKNNLKRLKDIRECLPLFLQNFDPLNDTNNLTRIEGNETKNVICAMPTATDESSADNLGRGLTQPCQWYDEFAFLKYNEIIYASASPANSQAALEAKRNKKPYHKLITTTPGDLNNQAGVYAKKDIINDAADFKDEIYDWKIKKVRQYIKDNSKNDFLFIEFSYKEIGRDEAWFEEQCRALNNNWFKIKREILLKWTKSSNLSPFTEEQIDYLYKQTNDVIGTIFLKNTYPLNIFKDFDFKKKVLIGVDTSGGLDKDSSAFTICDAQTLETIATFENSKVDVPEYCEIIYELCKYYFTDSVLIIERNSYGKTLIDLLLRTDIADKIYYEYKVVKAEKKIEDVKKKTTTKVKTKVFGISTDKDTRPQMMDLLFDCVTQPNNSIIAKPIVRDISGVERKKNGKIEHSETSHDDILMSYLFILWCWSYGTSLSKFFVKKTKLKIDNGCMDNNYNEDIIKSKMLSLSNYNKKSFFKREQTTLFNKKFNSNTIIDEYIDEENKMQELQLEQHQNNRKNMLDFIKKLNQ